MKVLAVLALIPAAVLAVAVCAGVGEDATPPGSPWWRDALTGFGMIVGGIVLGALLLASPFLAIWGIGVLFGGWKP